MAETPNTPTASKRVYEALRQDILERSFLPGARLSRPDLADSYGTSQTPVREALLWLEREGFVRVKPQAGTVVAPIDPVAVHQAYYLRRAVEIDVVRRLAKEPDRFGLGDEAIAGSSPEQDHAFHRALFSTIGMAELFDKLQPLLAPLQRCAALRSLPAVKQDEHRDILVRIKAGDPQGAGQAMASHLVAEIQDLAALQAEFPEMFEPVEGVKADPRPR